MYVYVRHLYIQTYIHKYTNAHTMSKADNYTVKKQTNTYTKTKLEC